MSIFRYPFRRSALLRNERILSKKNGFWNNPKGAAFIRQMMGKSNGPSDSEQAEAMGEGSEKIMQQMMFDMPLGSLVSYGRMTSGQLKELIAALNA